MQLIDDLREAADQLEKEAELIQEAKAIVKEFHSFYPFGINPELNEAYARAGVLLGKIEEL